MARKAYIWKGYTITQRTSGWAVPGWLVYFNTLAEAKEAIDFAEAEEEALAKIDAYNRDMYLNPDLYFEPDDLRRYW